MKRVSSPSLNLVLYEAAAGSVRLHPRLTSDFIHSSCKHSYSESGSAGSSTHETLCPIIQNSPCVISFLCLSGHDLLWFLVRWRYPLPFYQRRSFLSESTLSLFLPPPALPVVALLKNGRQLITNCRPRVWCGWRNRNYPGNRIDKGFSQSLNSTLPISTTIVSGSIHNFNAKTNRNSEGTLMCKIISVISCKGGVGKTTSAVNISAYLQMQGKRVCVVDLDAQHNLSRGRYLRQKRLP